ncbi:MAG: hypothetical protein ACEPOW_10320 [Bacteroidales bacterium]
MKNKIYKIGFGILSMLMLGFFIFAACSKDPDDPEPGPTPNPGKGDHHNLDVHVYNNKTDEVVHDVVVRVIHDDGTVDELCEESNNAFCFHTDENEHVCICVQGDKYIQKQIEFTFSCDDPSKGELLSRDIYVTERTPPVSIGQAGGVVHDQNENLFISIPEGAFSKDIDISVTDTYEGVLEFNDTEEITRGQRAEFYKIKDLYIEFSEAIPSLEYFNVTYKLSPIQKELGDFTTITAFYNDTPYTGTYNEEEGSVTFKLENLKDVKTIELPIKQESLDGFKLCTISDNYLKDNGISGPGCKVENKLAPYTFECEAEILECRPLTFKGISAEIESIPGDTYTGRVTSYVNVHEIKVKRLDGRGIVEDQVFVKQPKVILEYEKSHSGGGGN